MKFSSLLQYFSLKEKIFYAEFNLVASNIIEGSDELMKMMNCDSAEERKVIRTQIKAIEKKGDKYTNEIFDDLNITFITPFDREDIHQLTSNLDDVLDLMNACSEKVVIYRCNIISDNMRKMVVLINQGCIELQKAVTGLEGGLNKPEAITKACEEMKVIENKGDELYHQSISQLFENETDAVELVRQKEILQTLEKAINKIEDVSDVIKTILIKYA